MSMTSTNIRLIEVVDLRPFDWETGKREPIDDDKKSICDRCGKLHAKVYVVEKEGKRYDVGATCCNRMFGWFPTHEDLMNAEAVAKDKAVQAALQTYAQAVIDEVENTPVPALQYREARWTYFGYDYIFTIGPKENIGIRIESGSMTQKHPSEVVLTDADRVRFAHIWKRRIVHKCIMERYSHLPRTKQKKLEFGLLNLLEITVS